MSIVRNLGRAAAIMLVGFGLAACQTLGGSGLIASTVTAQLSAGGATSIAGDMVGQLTGHVGPGGTTVRLRGAGSPFGLALEDALRASGYAVVTDQRGAGVDAIDLAYVVDSFEGSVLVRLSTKSLDLTRIYRLEGEAAVAASPVSVMRRDGADVK